MYKDRLGFQCRDSSDVLAEENAALKAEVDDCKAALWRISPNTHTISCELNGYQQSDPLEGPGETYKDAYERLKAQVASLSARYETSLNEVADERFILREENAVLKVNSYPHMCRDGHETIGHSDGEHEMCPLCRALAEIERLKAPDAQKEKI